MSSDGFGMLAKQQKANIIYDVYIYIHYTHVNSFFDVLCICLYGEPSTSITNIFTAVVKILCCTKSCSTSLARNPRSFLRAFLCSASKSVMTVSTTVIPFSATRLFRTFLAPWNRPQASPQKRHSFLEDIEAQK